MVKQVNPSVYNKEYYLTACGGHEDWNKYRGEVLTPRLMYAWKLAKIKAGMKVLDWGTGRGEMAYQAAKMGAESVGIDYSNEAIKLANGIKRKTKGKLRFVVNTDLKLPLRDDSCDVIFFLDVIEHLYPHQVKTILQEFYRVLKPGGKVILHTYPNREHFEYGYPLFTKWIHRLFNLFWPLVFGEKLLSTNDPRHPNDYIMHINECSKSEVEEALQKSGLSAQVWYDSYWRIMRKRDYLHYYIAQPLWLSPRYFTDDIWAVGIKD